VKHGNCFYHEDLIMATVQECRQCGAINRPDATACLNGHSGIALVTVERPDYAICTNCGAPTPAANAVCSGCGQRGVPVEQPRPGGEAGAAGTPDQLAAAFSHLITSSKIADRVARAGDYLQFTHDGLEASIFLYSAGNLDVLFRYRSAKDLMPPPPNTFVGPFDRANFIVTANRLNAALGYVKIFLGPNEVWFQCCNPLFSSVALKNGKVDPEGLDKILLIALAQLLFTANQFFATVGRKYDRSNKSLPISTIEMPIAPVDYGREALRLIGIKPFFDGGSPPQANFFLDDYLFVLRNAKDNGRSFTLALPFLEEARFVPGQSVGNVIHGTTGARFLELCNEFNRGYGAVKSFCFVDAGQVYLTVSGHFPVVAAQRVADGFKHLFDVLYSCRSILFEKAGLQTSGFGTRLKSHLR
jgi:ribosomal protein L40E